MANIVGKCRFHGGCLVTCIYQYHHLLVVLRQRCIPNLVHYRQPMIRAHIVYIASESYTTLSPIFALPQVYAVATGLCVVEGRPKKSSSNQQDSDRDDYDPPKDDVVADGANVSHDPGRNFGRLVVDGCCNALAKALRSVRGARPMLTIPLVASRFR